MKFKFFFISYSVICAKYNYCFEGSNDMPVRYFNGKEWKLMKTRHGNFKMRDFSVYPATVKQTHTTAKAAQRSIYRTPDPFILVQLDKLMKKMKAIGLEATQATRQNIRSCGKKKTKTSTTEETTTETTPTEEITIQTTPTEEITTSTEEITTKTTTTEKATINTKTTTKTTTKKITTKKTTIITKPILKTTSKTMNRKKVLKFKRVATLKFKPKKLPRQITNNIKKATTKYNRFSCGNSRLKTTTTKKIGPRFLKMIIEQAWNMPLKNYWRPTFIPSQKSSNLCATKTIRKLFKRKTKKTTQTNYKVLLTTKETIPKTTTETTPTEEITPPTEEITTPTEEITTETTTSITTTQTPRTTTEHPATTTKRLAENTGIQADVSAGALSGNWSNLMREFLRFVEARKCEPSCKPETTITDLITTEPTNTEPIITKTTITKPTITKPRITKPTIITKPRITEPKITKPTTMPFPLLLLPDHQSAMSDTEDLMSILMGVNKDEKLNQVENNVTQNKAQHQGHDILRVSSEKDLQNITTRNIKEDNDTAEFNKQTKYLKHLKAKLYKRKSNKTYHISGTETYSDELEGKNFRAKSDETKSYQTIRVSKAKAYLDKVSKNAKILDGSEIESFLNMLKHKHARKKKKNSEDDEAQSYLDALNARYSENTDQNDDKDIRNHLNAIKDAHNRKLKDNLHNVSKPMFHSDELHDILAFIAPKRTDSTEIRSLPNHEDNFEIREERTTASNSKLMKNLKALRKKQHQIAKSYKYTTIMNFKYALDDI